MVLEVILGIITTAFLIQFRNANVFDTYLFENQEVLGNVLFRCESEQQYKLLEASLKLAKQVSILEQSMEDSDVR